MTRQLTKTELDHIERTIAAQERADKDRQQYRQQWIDRLSTPRVVSAREDARARNFW